MISPPLAIVTVPRRTADLLRVLRRTHHGNGENRGPSRGARQGRRLRGHQPSATLPGSHGQGRRGRLAPLRMWSWLHWFG